MGHKLWIVLWPWQIWCLGRLLIPSGWVRYVLALVFFKQSLHQEIFHWWEILSLLTCGKISTRHVFEVVDILLLICSSASLWVNMSLTSDSLFFYWWQLGTLLHSTAPFLIYSLLICMLIVFCYLYINLILIDFHQILVQKLHITIAGYFFLLILLELCQNQLMYFLVLIEYLFIRQFLHILLVSVLHILPLLLTSGRILLSFLMVWIWQLSPQRWVHYIGLRLSWLLVLIRLKIEPIHLLVKTHILFTLILSRRKQLWQWSLGKAHIIDGGLPLETTILEW